MQMSLKDRDKFATFSFDTPRYWVSDPGNLKNKANAWQKRNI